MARQLCEVEGGQLALLKNKELLDKVAAATSKHHKETKKYFIGFRSMDFTNASKNTMNVILKLVNAIKIYVMTGK